MTLLEQLDERIAKDLEMKNIALALEPCPFEFSLGMNGLVIYVDGFDGLHTAREYLRKHLGSWEDHLEMIWFSGRHIVSYTNDLPVEIWATWPPGDLPESLLGPGCHLVQDEKVINTWSVVCPIGDSK